MASLTPELKTCRLVLRPLELADAGQVRSLFAQWEIVRYLNNHVPWLFPPDNALTYFRNVALPARERGEQWHWRLRLKSSPQQITEAVEVVTDYWFETLKFPILRVPRAIANTASRRISERQGMRVVAVEEHEYVCGRLPTEIWEITAEEWRSRRSELTLLNRL